MNLGIIITLVAVAAGVYATLSMYLMFHYGRDHVYDPNPYAFWGSLSFQRKYFRNPHSTTHMYLTEPAPDSGWKKWYYKVFGIKYKERFFGSASFLVFLTDGMHLLQWILGNAICAAIAIGTGSIAIVLHANQSEFVIISFILTRVVWSMWVFIVVRIYPKTR